MVSQPRGLNARTAVILAKLQWTRCWIVWHPVEADPSKQFLWIDSRFSKTYLYISNYYSIFLLFKYSLLEPIES